MSLPEDNESFRRLCVDQMQRVLDKRGLRRDVESVQERNRPMTRTDVELAVMALCAVSRTGGMTPEYAAAFGFDLAELDPHVVVCMRQRAKAELEEV